MATGAVQLDELTWPEVRAELERGRETVVIALGATEQHGHHLPLATDALLGDELAWRVAERLGAFAAPTLRVGCSSHHLAFPGTLSLRDETFAAVLEDLLRSLARGGFNRAVLIPTHGGNFAPLGKALEPLGDHVDGIRVSALTDISVLLGIAELGESEFGIPLSEGGLHGGEWETSLLLACQPRLVHQDRAVAGFTGDPREAIASLFDAGVDSVAANGVIGDPTRASAEHGERYWAAAVELVVGALNR
jgi:creatinine amidohydrolase/Fe(II)-dependent formamide hydrolase-like protein